MSARRERRLGACCRAGFGERPAAEGNRGCGDREPRIRGWRLPHARPGTRPGRIARAAGGRPLGALAVAAAVVMATACDLPPGLDEVEPGGDRRREVGTADVSPVPDVRAGRGGDLWTTDFVGWQFGGRVNCASAQPGQPAGLPVADPFPTVVEIWDGVSDPCAEDPEEGARVLRIELSAASPGTYRVAQQCLTQRIAQVTFGEVRGGVLFTLVGLEGTVTILGLDQNDVMEGAFSVRFRDTGFTSGGFRGEPGCTSSIAFPASFGGAGGQDATGTPLPNPPLGG